MIQYLANYFLVLPAGIMALVCSLIFLAKGCLGISGILSLEFLVVALAIFFGVECMVSKREASDE